MTEWKEYRSPIVPTSVLMELREKAADDEEYKQLVDEWVKRATKRRLGGQGELRIKYRVIPPEEKNG